MGLIVYNSLATTSATITSATFVSANVSSLVVTSGTISVLNFDFMGVTTAIITATDNNQMTISQTTTDIVFRVQGNDGIWRSATVAITS